MEAIAGRAGLTVGALYRHFSAKGELLLHVVKQALSTSILLCRVDGQILPEKPSHLSA